MTTARAAAFGLILAAGLSSHAKAAEEISSAELLAQIQALKAQVEALQARLDGAPRPVATLPAPAPAAAPARPATPETRVAFDGAPRITVGDSSIKLRGRLLIDAIWQDVDRVDPLRSAGASQIRGRQAFLGVEGNIGRYWFYKVEGGAVNGGGFLWDDAVLEWRPNARNAIVIGNQKAVGLENLTSTRFTSFLDRGPMDNLIDASYHLGAYYWRTGENYSFNIGVTGHTLNNPDVLPGASGFHERLTASTRATVAPVKTAETVVHLGAWTRYRKRGDDGAFVYAVGYNSPLRVHQLMTTTAVGDNDLAVGLEGALVHKRFSVQGEFANVSVNGPARLLAQGADVRAGYAFVSFFPTGEMRAYNARGEFGRTRVKKPLGGGGFGSLELLARADFADLGGARAPNGGPLITGGDYKAVTLGATWQPINYVRFLANYTHGKIDNVGMGNDATINVFQLRSQIDW